MLYPQSNHKLKMLRPHRLSAIALAAMTLYSSGTSAAEEDQTMFSFGGFGSLGVVHSNESKADFTGNLSQPNGAGFTRKWSSDVDSRIGGQVDARFTSQLSAVLQVIAEQQWDNSYMPKVEWANVKYAFTPDFNVRAGRIALPNFLFSDSRKVGYTTVWVRPPQEVYQRVPIANNDGLDATYRFHIGKVNNSITAYVGRTRLKFPAQRLPGNLIKAPHLAGVVDTVKYGDLSLQAAYMRAKLEVPSLAAIPVPAISSLAGDSLVHFRQLGAIYDPGKWFVTGEWVKTRADLFGKRTAWYVTGGWRIDKFTPYVTYASQEEDTPALVGSASGQKNASTGVRWDVVDNVDVKLQYDRINRAARPSDMLLPVPGFQPGGKIGVFSAVVDFTF
ncbi:hypothetical protein C5614_11635 [Massilia phosphatilytica]|jgi:hypothetical protein|nr:hypothetical protein C5614_11635 [Massilia phosphatilytica]